MAEQRQKHWIAPPTDDGLKKQLVLKLKEYEERIAGRGKPWELWHPEQAHSLCESYRDACYKAYVLRAVLKSEKPVDAWQLSQELFAQWGEYFNVDDFNVACTVIDKHCGNLPDAPFLRAGTGLPPLQPEEAKST